MACANCAQKAIYVYEVTPSHQLYYCGKHLPVFLKERAKSGELSIPVVVPAAPKKKTSAPVVEEPVVEETVDEDGVN